MRYINRMNTALLNVLSEPNRLRIVELLRERPRSVGEIASLLDIRQPQATKHLQMLEKAGLALMYPQGQRRIYALQAKPLQELHAWVGAFKPNWLNPPDMLEEYVAAVKREQALAAENSSWADGRNVTITRTIAASRETLWSFWTNAANMKQWWSPEYLTTVYVESDPQPGGKIRVDMQDPDGTIHTAEGHYTELQKSERLDFMMSPLEDGRPVFESHDSVKFETIDEAHTKLTLSVRLAATTAAGASYIAALEMGWGQTLDKLERVLAAANGSETRM